MPFSEKPISQIIQILGLPECSVAIGYVIYFPIEDEYLGLSKITDEYECRTFSKVPDYSKIFDDYHEAVGEASQFERNTEVSILFDTGTQHVVTPVE